MTKGIWMENVLVKEGLTAKDRVYEKRRWIVLVASCFVNLCIGSLYAWSVFAAPMGAHLSTLAGADVGSLALVFSVANAVGPITMISGGVVNDRIGPRWVVFAGGALFGAGMIASGFATSVPVLTVSYGLGCGLGMGMVYGATVSNAVKFFPDKRGFVGGVTTASYGISSVIVPLIANALIAELDVTAAFKILGVSMAVIMCIAALFIEPCPAGFAPAGWQLADDGPRTVVRDKSWRSMLGDPMFYIMLAMLCCGAFAGLMVVSQASIIAQGLVGFGAAQAAAAVSALALANTAGRIVAGLLSDKLGPVATLRIVFALLVCGVGALYVSNASTVVLFVGGLLVVGLCFGSVMGVYPGFTALRFGSKNNSVNYGIMFIGFALAGILGPSIMNVLFEMFGSYQPAFAVAAALGVVGIGLTYAYARFARLRDQGSDSKEAFE